MDVGHVMIAPLALMGIMGGVFGVLLAIASIVFRVHQDDRIGKIRAALPGANCGGCGYPGCSGLADAIDHNMDVSNLLKRYLLQYKGKTKVVVLGCTHYPFVKKEIKEVLGNVTFYDGAQGTAKNLKKQLKEKQLISSSNTIGKVLFESSDSKVDLYKRYIEKNMEMKNNK